jgi:hypothetical protein
MLWGFFIIAAVLMISLTLGWIARDHKKTTIKLAAMPTPTVVGRLEDAETLMNAKLSELEDLKNRSLKNVTFDPNFKPPASNPADAASDKLQKMTERLLDKK